MQLSVYGCELMIMSEGGAQLLVALMERKLRKREKDLGAEASDGEAHWSGA